MFIRQENIIINTQVLPIITSQGSDIRFQRDTDLHSPYTKLKFKTIKACDKAFDLIYVELSQGSPVVML
tara:strand:- start:1354 stop:1560 length:207 start_codon:yes stop_codon:yes gene_type:complete